MGESETKMVIQSRQTDFGIKDDGFEGRNFKLVSDYIHKGLHGYATGPTLPPLLGGGAELLDCTCD